MKTMWIFIYVKMYLGQKSDCCIYVGVSDSRFECYRYIYTVLSQCFRNEPRR